MTRATGSVAILLKRALLLWSLLTAAVTAAQTFTATQDGDWNNPATWGQSGSPTCHTTIPCMTDAFSGGAPTNGDRVDLNGNSVTCSTGETCSFGTSQSAIPTMTACTWVGGAALINSVNRGGLTIQTGATFIRAGHACLKNGSRTIQQGATIYHDSSWAVTPISYQFLDSAVGGDPVNNSWSVGTLNGSAVTMQGDSYYSPNRCNVAGCNTNCTTAGASAGCMSEAVFGLTTVAGSGPGTFYNLHWINSPGQWGSRSTGSQNITIDQLWAYNSGQISFRWGSSGTFSVSRSYITACASSIGFSPYAAITTGTVIFTSNYIECSVGNASGSTKTTFINTVMKASWNAGANYTAGVQNFHPGYSSISANSDTADQNMYYLDGWSYAGAEPTGMRAAVPVSHITNSLIVSPRGIATGGPHIHPGSQVWASSTPGGTWQQINNVYATFGSVDSATTVGQIAITGGGADAASPVTAFTITGNVSSCGVYGNGSTVGGDFYSTGIPVATFNPDIVKDYQNTRCATAPSIGSQYGMGFVSVEAGTYQDSMFDNNANIYFSNTSPGLVSVLEISLPGAVTNVPWNYLNYNAVINGKTTDASSAPCGTYVSSCAIVHNPPTTATEIIIPAIYPDFADPMRTPFLFEDYLDKSGLFKFSEYATPHTIDLGVHTVTTNYRGRWATGTAYAEGDIVYTDQSIGSPSYTGVWPGRTVYWICKVGHTAGTTNAPLLGINPSSRYTGAIEMWEPAFMPLWLKPAVVASTTYGNGSCTDTRVCNDGALGPLYGSNPMYAVGLINAWVRAGFRSMMPQTWGAVQAGTHMCSRDNGVTPVECGAMPMPIVRHLPPAGTVN